MHLYLEYHYTKDGEPGLDSWPEFRDEKAALKALRKHDPTVPGGTYRLHLCRDEGGCAYRYWDGAAFGPEVEM